MRSIYILILFLISSIYSAQIKKKKALFIGNSYTYVNNMPQLIKDIALSKSDTLIFDQSLLGGATFNTHYNKAVGTDATPDSHYNAIWLADLLGRFISEDVLIANHWMLTSSGGQGGWGLIGRGELRPSYYTYQLYKMFGTQRVFSSSDVANLNVYAAKTESGALTVMLVNLNDEAQTVPLTLNGIAAPATAQVWRLDPTHNAEALPDLALTQTSAVELPGQSVTLLVIK